MRRVTFFRVRLDAAQEADERALNAFIAKAKMKKIVPVLVQNALPNFWSVYVEYEENSKELLMSKSLEGIRQQHPRAYEKWTKDDDTRLKHEYGKDLSIEQLSEVFQRQPSAIRSRLRKLGLTEQEFKT